MRSDLAALIPPLVIAAAFIAGVVALLRREMAPRRPGGTRPGRAQSRPGAHTEMKRRQIPHETQNSGDDGSADNSMNDDVVVSSGTEPSGCAQDGSVGPVHEDDPPAQHTS
jgi:hypothetical protein